MTFIVPFEDEFCGEIQTIYSVNNDNPKKTLWGNTTTSEKCPNCGERNFYRVYDSKDFYTENGYEIEIFDCKCPNCRKEFDLKIEDKID